jgi:hypothetical protein
MLTCVSVRVRREVVRLLRPALLKAKGDQREPVCGGNPLNRSPMTMQETIIRNRKVFRQVYASLA